MRRLALPPIVYSSKQFAIWRMAFGAYLTYYNARLLPYATELFSRAGPFSADWAGAWPSPRSNDALKALSAVLDGPVAANAILVLCIACSVAILAGVQRRPAAFVLWVLSAWLYHRNAYTESPDYSFTNWLIFMLAWLPAGEAWSVGTGTREWRMPPLWFWGAWIVLASGYLAGALSKLHWQDPAWRDGTALYYVLVTDNSRRTWYGTLFTMPIPSAVLKVLTWGTLAVEGGAPVFMLLPFARPVWWLSATLLQVGILVTLHLPQVSLGMLLYHAFLFDPRWLSFLGRLRGHSIAAAPEQPTNPH